MMQWAECHDVAVQSTTASTMATTYEVVDVGPRRQKIIGHAAAAGNPPLVGRTRGGLVAVRTPRRWVVERAATDTAATEAFRIDEKERLTATWPSPALPCALICSNRAREPRIKAFRSVPNSI